MGLRLWGVLVRLVCLGFILSWLLSYRVVIMLSDLAVNEGMIGVPSSARLVDKGLLSNRYGLQHMNSATVAIVGLIGKIEDVGELMPVLRQTTLLASLFKNANIIINHGNISESVESSLRYVLDLHFEMV